jgi:hypothetical protein
MSCHANRELCNSLSITLPEIRRIFLKAGTRITIKLSLCHSLVRLEIYSTYIELVKRILYRITPLLLVALALITFSIKIFAEPPGPHGYIYIAAVFISLYGVIVLLIDYLLWKNLKIQFYWLWLLEIAIIAIGYFATNYWLA